VGLDLGSTRIKAATLDARGRLGAFHAVPAPPLHGRGGLREGDPDAYVAAALGLLAAVSAGLPRGIPLGVAAQRSTFSVWDRQSGRARLPLISWQDRRAASWCAAHRDLASEVAARTGLRLSPHYVGPKLAALQADTRLARDLRGGGLLWGTLDVRLLWSATDARRHEIDVTMAARTCLLDLATERWSPELLERFRVSPAILPRVVDSAGRGVELALGPCWCASLADQAAAVLASLDPVAGGALVNLGTGAFVLVSAERGARRRHGYLFAPVLAAGATRRYVLEGAVNGPGSALDRPREEQLALPETDPGPECFALPDGAGLGAPHWRPEVGLVLSEAALRLDRPGRRRVVLEGVLFRVRQLLEGLSAGPLPARIRLSGGLAREPAVCQGLAALLGRPVERLAAVEAGLLGAARLAAGLPAYGETETERFAPGGSGAYLAAKYPEWRSWLARLLRPARPLRPRGPRVA
jgi:glycerol kinase